MPKLLGALLTPHSRNALCQIVDGVADEAWWQASLDGRKIGCERTSQRTSA